MSKTLFDYATGGSLSVTAEHVPNRYYLHLLNAIQIQLHVLLAQITSIMSLLLKVKLLPTSSADDVGEKVLEKFPK